MSEYSFPPIPTERVSDTELSFSRVDEPFVDVYEYSDGRIAVDMEYLKRGYDGAIDTAYLRLEVARRLLAAAELLPEGYRLKIYDAWRPYEVQAALYYEYYGKLLNMPENEGLSEEELHKMARTFVSFPDRSVEFAFVHSSGGAVDLTVIDGKGEEIDMGTGFDDFTELAATRALEGVDHPARENRRMLYHAMCGAGFTNYSPEWWHYDLGDKFHARASGDAVKYASVYSVSEMTVQRRKQNV